MRTTDLLYFHVHRMGSPLPLDAGIKTRDTESPVGELPGHLHLPDGLRRRGLSHFVDRRVLSRKCRSALVELDVAVDQQARVAPEKGKKPARDRRPIRWCGLGRLIKLEDGDAAHAGRGGAQISPLESKTRLSPLSNIISWNVHLLLELATLASCCAYCQSTGSAPFMRVKSP